MRAGRKPWEAGEVLFAGDKRLSDGLKAFINFHWGHGKKNKQFSLEKKGVKKKRK